MLACVVLVVVVVVVVVVVAVAVAVAIVVVAVAAAEMDMGSLTCGYIWVRAVHTKGGRAQTSLSSPTHHPSLLALLPFLFHCWPHFCFTVGPPCPFCFTVDPLLSFLFHC